MLEELSRINLRIEEIKNQPPSISLVWERSDLEDTRDEILLLINEELEQLKEE